MGANQVIENQWGAEDSDRDDKIQEGQTVLVVFFIVFYCEKIMFKVCGCDMFCCIAFWFVLHICSAMFNMKFAMCNLMCKSEDRGLDSLIWLVLTLWWSELHTLLNAKLIHKGQI